MAGLLSGMQGGMQRGPGAPMTDSPAEEQAEDAAGHNPEEEAAEAPAGPGMEQGEQPNVSPEEQAEYDRFIDQAFRLVYDEKSFPAILKRLTATPDPVEGLAAVVVMVVSRLKDSAQQQGVEVSPGVLFHGGSELLEDIADTAAKAGIHQYTDQEMEKALYRALDLYRAMDQRAGGDRQAFQQDWDALVQADRQGRLGDLVPQLAGASGQGGAPQQGQQQEHAPPSRGLLRQPQGGM
ncbi:hypothetical protein CRT60_21755 [Azospirillum palustre]|uniref:Uncharacterized protein n=1 Tax=Azospirillum palustre TaxID=2044885 RepID=A0A2B8BDM7_9PROT|nr:hypothetical protein [Azospirillum palustre]PGH55880.1 hypothetical protein CRT60_21755 [Azospirillum palustre]